MPKSKKLEKQIENKLEKLDQLINKINEAKAINSDDPETWDADTLYNLVEDLKETLQLLEDQKSKQLDSWGDPIVLEEGLCSLMNAYLENEEEEKDD